MFNRRYGGSVAETIVLTAIMGVCMYKTTSSIMERPIGFYQEQTSAQVQEESKLENITTQPTTQPLTEQRRN